MCLALALSSLCTTVPQLIATQGVLYAIGGSITYSPCIVYLDEWFARRKGLAYGVMWSGTGLAGVILPLFLEYLLSTHGYETTLRIFAGLVFALTAPLAYFVRPRVPIPSGGSSHTKPFSSFRFVYSRPFLLYQLFNAVEATGFFLPGIYLPSYASSVLKAGPFPSALPVLLLNVASVFGCVAMGSLIDRADVTTCILVSTAGATAGTFLLWGLSTNLAVLYVFAIVYGLFAGSFTSAWPGIMRDITRREKLAAEVASSSNSGSEGENNGNNRTSTADPSMVFAFLALGRGVGNVVSGPLSEALIRNSPWKGEAFSGYGSGFGTLIAFTGATALFGGGSFLWKKLGWL
ncbi:major facilitator superfamily domain-containing protein [Echria macrotheca]|uniref:Major facilitator superfamily domain-containing protein n=1 Tax=Echria macrotheca TaxID=438768 RepID=A0AAJ0BFY6_9PEZI|nr:major facilitator superfamily domain-containing protein [Echria macrotheca]